MGSSEFGKIGSENKLKSNYSVALSLSLSLYTVHSQLTI